MELILYTRPGCHLCERLEQLIAPALTQRNLTLTRRDIHDDDAWYEAYWSRIPVLMNGETILLEGKPTEAEIARAMKNIP